MWTEGASNATVRPPLTGEFQTSTLMPGLFTPAPDDNRISGVAAIAALVGHAAVILAALLLAGRAPQAVNTDEVVGVTLVSGLAGAGAAPVHGPAATTPLAAAKPAPNTPTPAIDTAGDRLDRLTAPTGALPTPANPAANARSAPASSSPTSTVSALIATGTGRTGSSRADQGLGEGEGAEGVDLYAAASLPAVGARPTGPQTGDLWSRVAPCWRPAAAREATLIVDLRADGTLASTPQAVRKAGVRADPLALLAERSAVRALQACAPYGGLGGRRWRVGFSG